MDRRDKAFAYIDLNGRGLEIGASHSPLLPKSSGARIQTVDHASKAELVEKYRALGIKEEMLANIEDVDHVWTHGSLADAIGEPGAFDFIIGSHIIEHMVDLIGFLQACESLLRDGGRLSLLVPDKRYCFDLFEPLTTVGTAVNGHLSGARFHPFGTVLDHHAYACVRGPGIIAWDSVTTTPVGLQFDDLRTFDEEVERGRRQDEYVDVHRWRFTPSSFRLLIQDLRDLGYHNLAEVGGFDTAGSEFFVTLSRSAAAPPRQDRLEMLVLVEQETRSGLEPVVPEASAQAAIQEADRLRAALAASEVARSEATSEAERLRAELATSQQTLTEALTSRSWRVTAPLRGATRALRRQGH